MFKNTRNTLQKGLVLEAVNSLKCHATAEEVYKAVSSDYKGISLATVYRNLNFLTKAGEIAKIEIPNASDRFDHITKKHSHLRCKICGKLFDARINYDSKEFANAGTDIGFLVEDFNLLLIGKCAECKDK